MNAENGFEAVRFITPAEQRKKVVVIGGGPAGLEAARVAATKGHEVTLFEKQNYLGGQLNIASVPPRKIEIRRSIEDLTQACQQVGVQIHQGHEADTDSILALSPDAVIVATGANSFMPPIVGIDDSRVCDAWKVLAGEQQATGRVVIIGGGIVGCETAEYLAEQGCQVAIVEMSDKVGAGIGITVLPSVLETYRRYGVTQHPGLKVTRIEPNHFQEAQVQEAQEGQQSSYELNIVCEDQQGNIVPFVADFAVIASGARPQVFDSSDLLAQGIEVVEVGDCVKVADISHAIKTAYDAANSI
ncbi:FAD-dependent oxidoreductase [Psychrobacter sp. UBA3962]|uniref:FAD-dependent oxidoreductase n=1 Tax=Psychrobacter sp. UBA3962 TaxID=1947352 RepID=UPI0025D87C28|nr:FAD/NAD(P)-binding oxidoreductase [Psychrobacter sp. UBA3962]